MGGLGLYKRPRTRFLCLDWLASERRVSLTAKGFQFFYFFVIFTGVMRKEKGGKRGKKKMEERQEEREKEGGELEERTEERTEEMTEEGTEERIEDTEEGLEVTQEACKENEMCEEESECHSAAKRARVCATFTDSQENAIVEFVKEHPELYDKEHGRFHDRQRKVALWAEICRTEAPAL